MSKGYWLRMRTAWVGWRNRVLASPRFQQAATRFWPTRPIARARARELFDLVAGFVYTQTLTACVQTGLLDLLARGPTSTEHVSEHCALPPPAALRLLRSAAALRLVDHLGEEWVLGRAGAALCGNAGITEMVAHHPMLYADLADPVGLLRRGGGGGRLANYWGYARTHDALESAEVDPYSRLMAASQPLVAAQIVRSYRFSRHRRMLDIGGGEGRFLETVARTAKALNLGLFDLPAVVERGRARLGEAGLESRTTFHAGSFLVDPLPRGYDLITLVRVLHDHDDAPALRLLRAIHDALPAGGRLLIAEPMAGTRGAEPAGDAYFGMYLFAMGSGRPRTSHEINAMLRLAGFATARTVATALPLTCSIIVASRGN
ncbi:methyltransferase [Sphingomonas echinoides]|uniref:methyltransferase n=1 Tax=Sphingomonas echinoides TaxID=59803 RepID=UPI00241323D3|nr:methyltransferase [Sphingomonas echinoides]